MLRFGNKCTKAWADSTDTESGVGVPAISSMVENLVELRFFP
jgi:hypothetical protein